ncbi:MAG: N-acetylmuramoyl-L-alanine amidase [Rhizobiaceae bacterium]
MSLIPDTRLACDTRCAANFNERPAGASIALLVLHYTGMESADAAVERLCVEESQVSCHYLVHVDGGILQMVAEEKRAWHAGVSSWRGRDNCNDVSIGIEIVNPGHEFGYTAFAEAQIKAVTALSHDIAERHGLEARNIVAHSDIAPLRKEDPGELFPWDELHAAGVGHWVDPEPVVSGRFLQKGDGGPPIAALRDMLRIYGYGLNEGDRFDDHLERVLIAFQRHFRPARIDGIADHSTVTTLHRLIKALPEGVA